jgi:hypothetical protein
MAGFAASRNIQKARQVKRDGARFFAEMAGSWEDCLISRGQMNNAKMKTCRFAGAKSALAN